MGEETHNPETVNRSRKRKPLSKGGKLEKKKKQKQVVGFKVTVKKIDPKLKKFLRKKARDYNSEDEGEEDEMGNQGEEVGVKVVNIGKGREEYMEEDDLGSGEEEGFENVGGEEGEDGGIQPGIARFSEGCRAFRIAFLSIMKKSGADDDSLGPVLSGHKKLVVEKLAEEVPEKKARKDRKKEKHWVPEKGHVKPDNYLDSHEKFLIGVATKGVVKLFNAVNKAQHAQKGLNPSRSKDAKVIKKRRKEAFFSELSKNHSSSGTVDNEGPSWAPLRDNYMLTNSKLKNWDKMPDTHVEEDIGKMSEDSSSDDD